MKTQDPKSPAPDFNSEVNEAEKTIDNSTESAATKKSQKVAIENAADNFRMLPRNEKIIEEIAHYIVLALSAALIIFISYDTFNHIPFLKSSVYMTFQFWVCVAFLIDFFMELYFAPDKKIYFGRRWFFLLVSIPYLNIIEYFDVQFADETLYFIRFIPLIRGAYSLAMVVGYFSSNRAFTILAQYAFILLAAIYFASLLFFYEEREVNPQVVTYWDSLYWAFLNVTTVGSSISAVTILGKILTVCMAMSGMMMLPLFTVYVTDRVKAFNDRAQVASEFMSHLRHHSEQLDAINKKLAQQQSASAQSASAQSTDAQSVSEASTDSPSADSSAKS